MSGFPGGEGANILPEVARRKASRAVGKTNKKSSGKQSPAMAAVELFPEGVPSETVLKFKNTLVLLGFERVLQVILQVVVI